MLLLFSQGEISITGNRPALEAIRGSNGDFLLTDNTGGGHAIYSAAIHSYPTDGRILLAKFCVTAKYTADDFTVIDEVADAGDILHSAIIGDTVCDSCIFQGAAFFVDDSPTYFFIFKVSYKAIKDSERIACISPLVKYFMACIGFIFICRHAIFDYNRCCFTVRNNGDIFVSWHREG